MKSQVRMKGISASPGVAIARTRLVSRQQIRIPQIRFEHDDVERETTRLMAAVNESRKQIETSLAAITSAGGGHGDHSLILQAHLLMLNDELIIDGAVSLIRDQLINAEWALHRKMNEVSQMLAELGDDYLKERSQDVEFVGNRVLRNLLGHGTELLEDHRIDSTCIVISSTLSPAETAQMVNSPVLAFAIEEGTQTSHTAIMAQALGIPAVVGVEHLMEHIGADDLVIVDGLEGFVIIRPNDETVTRYKEKAARYTEMESKMRSTRDDPAITVDGCRVKLNCNIELPAEVPLALDYGAEGVGLYRTEFLFIDRATPPGEEEQYKVYQSVMRAMAPRPVVFRTFDLGADKMPTELSFKERNPALGMRAIRIGLKNRDTFRTQLKALLRTAPEGDLRIMFPMISGVSELRQVKSVLKEAQDELHGINFDDVQVGCMIELPSAVFVADLLAKEVDFFSIGTNDLIQYSLAIDRGNDHVAYLYTPFYPSILRAIKTVIDAAENAGIEVSMCGGAASETLMAPLLIGMGLRNLSMAPMATPFVKAAIRSIDSKEASNLVMHAMEMNTAVEIEELAQRYMQDKTNLDINPTEPS